MKNVLAIALFAMTAFAGRTIGLPSTAYSFNPVTTNVYGTPVQVASLTVPSGGTEFIQVLAQVSSESLDNGSDTSVTCQIKDPPEAVNLAMSTWLSGGGVTELSIQTQAVIPGGDVLTVTCSTGNSQVAGVSLVTMSALRVGL